MINQDRFDVYMKCINIVREESELEGDPPEDLLEKMKGNPAPYLRNTVLVTKERIVKRITEELNRESLKTNE